jgi:hypothetical protein
MDLKDIICKIMRLRKDIRDHVMAENYLLFKKFIKQFSLNKRLKKSDMPAYVDVFNLIKENIQIS